MNTQPGDNIPEPIPVSRRFFRPGIQLLLVYVVVFAGWVLYTLNKLGVFEKRHPSNYNTIITIRNSIDQYEEAYDRLPVLSPDPQTVDAITDTSGVGGLIAILLGINQERNSRRTNFLGDLPDKSPGGGGLLRTNATAALFDYWGRVFRVLLDTNGDGIIADPASGSKIKARALVWSAGKDGNYDTWEDNEISWNR